VRFWDWQIDDIPGWSEFLGRRIWTTLRDSGGRRDLDVRRRRIVERDYQTIDRSADWGVPSGRRNCSWKSTDGKRARRQHLSNAFRGECHHSRAVPGHRNTLAKQTEDAFAEHYQTIPVPAAEGRRFQDEKRVTITTLQSMINIYRDYSAGYFDLLIRTNAIAAFTAMVRPRKL